MLRVRETSPATTTKCLCVFFFVVFMVLLDGLGLAQIKGPNIQVESLPNGIRILMIEQRQLPMVYMQLMIRGGSRFDPIGQEGLADFTARMLSHGTKNRTGRKIAEEIDFLGGELSSWADLERTFVSAKVLKKDFKTGMLLLSDIVRNPVFPEEEMTSVRNQLLGTVSGTQDDPTELVNEHLRFALFGREHELGQVMTAESVKSITREDVEKFYSRYYWPNSAILVVVGDFDRAEVLTESRAALVGWPSTDEAVDMPRGRNLSWSAARAPNGYEVRLVQKSGQTQMQIGLAHGGIMFQDPDYLATQLANYVLGGGGFSSRLLQVIRSEEGKTYSVYSRFTPYKSPGIFQINTFSRNEEAFNTLGLIMRELKAFKQNGITDEELERAKGAIAGRHVLRFETLQGLSQAVLDQEYYNRGMDWLSDFPRQVRAITRNEVNTAIQNRFNPENMVVVLMGDRKIFEGHGTILGNVATSEISVVNWSEPVTAQGKPLRLLSQEATATHLCPVNEICATTDEKTKPLLTAWAQVQGGLAELTQIKDSHARWSGKTTLNGQMTAVDVDQYWVHPDKLHLLYDIKTLTGSIKFIQIINGEEGWVKVQNRIRDLRSADFYGLGKELFFFQSEILPKILADPAYKFTLIGTETVGNKKTDMIEVRTGTSRPYRCYLEQSSHRLLRLDLVNEKQEYYYSEYKQIGKLWTAHKLSIFIDGKLDTEITLQDVQYNQGLDPKLFERPQ